MIEWKDETSYSRGERGEVEPRTWIALIHGVSITVTRYVHDRTQWWLDCRDLDISYRVLGSDLELSRADALALVHRAAREKATQLQALLAAIADETAEDAGDQPD